MGMSKEAIGNAACIEAGIGPVTSFLENTTQAVVLNTVYDTVVDNELSLYPWRFCMKQVQLSKLSTDPLAEWDSAWQLPSDVQYIKAVYINGTPRPFERFEDTVLNGAGANDTVIAEYTYRVNELKWPEYFTRLIILRLATSLASGVANNGSMAESFRNAAELQYQRARHTSSTQKTNSQFKSTRLTSSRNRGTR